MDSSKDDFNNSPTVQITGKVMVVAIIVLFMVVVFVLFLHLYAKWFWWRVEQPPAPSAHRRRRSRSRFVFAPGQDPASTLRTGLDPVILRSIPVIVVNPEDFKEGLECAVCLSELVQGEKARLLPKCNHGFHVECIDMWFQSHSTCPLCRNPVDVQQGSNSLSVELESAEVIDIQDSHDNLVSGYSTESPNFPTNVLFWGNETQVSTGGTCLDEGPSSSSSNSGRPAEIVVIDIEEGVVEEEEKSPVPPTRLRSFKRLLSREKKVNPTTSSSNNCSGSSCDDEQIRR